MTSLSPKSGASERRRRYRALVRRDGEKCAFCDATGDLTVDHIVPKAHGGSNRIENLQLLCRPCNQTKGDTFDASLVTNKRLRRTHFFTGPKRAPGSHSSLHLPGCDATYCMYGCPVYKERSA